MSQHAQDKRRQAVAEKFQQDFFTTDSKNMDVAFNRMSSSPSEQVSRMLDGFGLTGLIDFGFENIDCRPGNTSKPEIESAEPLNHGEPAIQERTAIQLEITDSQEQDQGPENCEWFAQLLQRAADIADMAKDIPTAA